MKEFISGLKKKRESKSMLPKPKKEGTLGKKGQVYKNNLLNTDLTSGQVMKRRIP